MMLWWTLNVGEAASYRRMTWGPPGMDISETSKSFRMELLDDAWDVATLAV